MGPELAGEAEVAVDAGHGARVELALLVDFADGRVEIALEALADGGVGGPDDGTEEGRALCGVLQDDLAGMELQGELVGKEAADGAEGVAQGGGIGVDEVEIVDVAAVAAEAEGFSDERVERVEVEVGEDLAGEVADGEAATGGGGEQAFVGGEAVPVGALSGDLACICGIGQGDGPGHLQDQIHIQLPVLLADELPQTRPQLRARDGHEEAPDVQLQHEAAARMGCVDVADVVLEVANAIQRALAHPAGVAAFDEQPLEMRVEFGHEPVVHHAVGEGGCEHFALHGLAHDECGAG